MTKNYYATLPPTYDNSKTIVMGHINSNTMQGFGDAFKTQTRYYKACWHLKVTKNYQLHYNLCTIILKKLQWGILIPIARKGFAMLLSLRLRTIRLVGTSPFDRKECVTS